MQSDNALIFNKLFEVENPRQIHNFSLNFLCYHYAIKNVSDSH